MVPQAIQPHLDDIVYEMAAIVKPIPLKGVVESLGNIAPAVGDNCKEVHVETKQLALLRCRLSNTCPNTIMQQLGNILRRDKSRHTIEACRECTHLHGQLPHPTPYRILTPATVAPNGGEVGTS